MEKLKFAYQVEDEDYSFITIWELHENSTLFEGKNTRYIFKEEELQKYIKKFPNCNSVWFTEAAEKEAKRLFENYKLSMK